MDSMDSDTINRAFTKAYNNINHAYNDASGEDTLALNLCIVQARALLDEPAIPRFHRIKTLLLLASIVGDRDEAVQLHRDANILYRILRAHETPGASVEVAAGLAQLSEYIEELRAVLADERSAEEEEEPKP